MSVRSGPAVRRTIAWIGGVASPLVLAALVLIGAAAAPAMAPRLPGKHSTSINWSGYAVQTNLQSPESAAVSEVDGTWTVPAVSATLGNSFSAAWIGIDGYSSRTVEQIGTEQDWYNGSAHYSAWWEMYPKPSNTITTMTISPGDVMSAEVKYVGNGRFKLTITNTTTGKTFTTTQKSMKAKRSSAEWIMEAPSGGRILGLAQFGTINFGDSSATIKGHTGSISDAAWQYDPMTMTTIGGTTIAVPSALGNGGTTFSVTRQ